MIIAPGPASSELAHQVARILGLQTLPVDSKIFPDGESYFRFMENVRGQDVAVIQSAYPPQDRNLIQLFLMLDGLRGLGCRKLYAIVPYLAYMRQDKTFLKGEIVSARSIIGLLKCLRIDQLITIDMLNASLLSYIDSSGRDLTAMPLLADWIKSHDWKAPLIVAPDKGASQRAQVVSESLGTDFAVGMKSRDRHTGKVTMEFDASLSVEERVVVIVDDIIARGDTIIKAAEILLDRGAKNVAAGCTHGLFLENAVQRIEDAGVKEIVSSDTVPSVKSKIRVAPLIADALRPLASQKAHG